MRADSWKRLLDAANFYESKGFVYQNVSWAVDASITGITKPKTAKDIQFYDKCLIGSAEQGFLEIYDELDDCRYYSISPCFRDEIEDELHQRYFMKLELFSKDPNQIYIIRDYAFEFFEQYGNPKIVSINHLCQDIEINGIEVGSYMNLERDNKRWVCGTGIAEPRLTKALISN